jgi:hypothetical protein
MKDYSQFEICEQISESLKNQEQKFGVPKRVVEEKKLHDEKRHQRWVLLCRGERRRERLSRFQTRKEVLPIHAITSGKCSKSICISNNVEANSRIHKEICKKERTKIIEKSKHKNQYEENSELWDYVKL